jgi:GxxExxY protein
MGKMKDKVIHRDLSYRVMRAVFEVHNTLGPGFVDGIYEEALACELERRHIPFERQKQVTVHYKGHVVGTHRLDFVIEGKIVLELKAVSALTDVFKQQTLSYLKATGLRFGILINFGTPRVEYQRVANQSKKIRAIRPFVRFVISDD